MPKLHFVKKARQDNPAVKKGESYFWWKFAFSPKSYSKSRPSRSQLTQSSFLSQIWDLEDEISTLTGEETLEDLAVKLEEFKSIAEDLREEVEENLNNMPEQLQYDSVLERRLESMQEFCNELDAIELDDSLELPEEPAPLPDLDTDVSADQEYAYEVLVDEHDHYNEAKSEIEKQIEEAIEQLRELTYQGE